MRDALAATERREQLRHDNAVQASSARATKRSPRWSPGGALTHGPIVALLVAGVVAGITFLVLGGSRYYTTPLAVRGYEKAHRILRPSGVVGQSFGIAGAILLLLTLLYWLRKRVPFLARRGNSKRWLEVHIFFGILGPALITLHTSFKFNGLISVAYWSMILVVLSGFVGRYLYVRIPRTLRGTELSLEEIRERADDLKRRIDGAGLPPGLARELDDEATGQGLRAALRIRRHLRSLKKELRLRGVRADLLDEMAALATERALLVRQLATLEQTKKLFDLWHVFHRPLVWLMFAIAAAHVALALYMGYSMLHF
jgi:hypothetical protein